MAEFTPTTEQKVILPQLKKTLELNAGGKIADDTETINFAMFEVPEGKIALVDIIMVVRRLEDV